MSETLNPWDALSQLLEYGQFELLDFHKVTSEKDSTDCRVIYLMNDAVESFLVFKNVRYTGKYLENYDGEIESNFDRENNVLRINQGTCHFLLFFDSLEMETHYYNYGHIGHFWIKGFENLRNIEFQIAILRDKYDYLGPSSCNALEIKLASLKNFPPLNYLFYPATPEKYITYMPDPWAVSSTALDFFEEVCDTVGDSKLLRIVQAYHRKPSRRLAKKIAKRLCYTKHKAVPDYIFSLLCQAAAEYPRRTFGEEMDSNIHAQLKKAEQICAELQCKNQTAIIYHEEPFVCDCDDITFKVYVMVLKDGWRKQRRIVVQEC